MSTTLPKQDELKKSDVACITTTSWAGDDVLATLAEHGATSSLAPARLREVFLSAWLAHVVHLYVKLVHTTDGGRQII